RLSIAYRSYPLAFISVTNLSACRIVANDPTIISNVTDGLAEGTPATGTLSSGVVSTAAANRLVSLTVTSPWLASSNGVASLDDEEEPAEVLAAAVGSTALMPNHV